MNTQSLLQLLRESYRSGIRSPKYRWLILLGTLFYLASPVDIVPDVIPGAGWIDDGLIATLLVTEVSQLILERFKTQGQTTANPQSDSHTAEVIDVDAVSMG